MTDYKPIADQLARVRRAWKRSSALAGLAVTILEAVGLFTVMVLIDLLFQPGLQGRLVLMGLVAIAVMVLLVRHVLRPLFRRLPDEQVALYVEEHNPGFEGALIAAAEFGRQPDQPGREAVVASILKEAERRAARLDIRSVAKLLRLRKYAWSAAAVVAAYGAAGLLFPQTVGRQAVRVMAPWRTPNTTSASAAAAAAVKPALEFTLSATNADVLRGGAFRLEAGLSRDPDTTVQLHFRSLGEAGTETRWYAAPMKSIDKVHAYEGVLPDINEDMECYVSAERGRSAACRIRVYDPLAVEAVEVVTHYSAYLELPDRTDRRPNGDVSAPEGSTVTLRVLANRPLKTGRLTWAGAGTQPMTPLAGEPMVAAAKFTVTSNCAYRFRIEDAMGQVVESLVDAYVKVLPDGPPTLVLKRPTTPPESVTPLSEISVAAVANDDFGVAGVDLVYRCGAETEGPEQRVPLMLDKAIPEPGVEAAASLAFRLDSVTPRLRGGEVLAWHLEARDRKHQTAATDLVMTPVRYLDVWAVEQWEKPEIHAAEEEPPSLAAILQNAFQLSAHRAQLAPRDLDRQTDDLALTMINAKTKAVWVFLEVKPATPPADVPKIKRVNALAIEGHTALAAHRLDPAVDALRRAVMLMISMGLLEDMKLMRMPPPPAGGAQNQQNEQQNQQQMEALNAVAAQAAKDAKSADKDHKMEQANKADELQKKLAGLAGEQQKNADKANELNKKAAEAAAKSAPAPDQKGARGQAAADQAKLSEAVKKAADEVEKDKGLEAEQRQKAGGAMREAARHMDNAAHEMKEGRLEKAAQEAAEAHQKLSTARDELGTTGQEKLAEALAKAANLADRAKRQQQEIAKATEAAAKAKGSGANAERLKGDMQALANQQAHVKVDLDALQEMVTALKQAADNGNVRPDAAGHIQAAEQELRRGRASQKAVNAAVALTALKPEDAGAEHQNILETLDKAHAHLQQASDGMATGYEAELKRARREAEQAAQKLKELKSKPKAGTEGQGGGQDAVDTASQLARHVQARDFVSPESLKGLQAQVQQAQSGTGRLEEKPAKVEALAAAVGKVRDELEVAYAKLQENKSLFSSQREECPPQYRPLVNKYFETLSGNR